MTTYVNCRNCHGSGKVVVPDVTQLIAERRTAMTDWCRANGEEISWDGYVADDTAAKLLRCACGTLANKRFLHEGPPFRKRGRDVDYSIAELAAFDVMRELTQRAS